MANELAGKICVVTGATGGIGKVTARELARKGATVVLVGRDAKKAEDAATEIRQATGNDKVETLLADLGSQAAIRRAAAEYKRRFTALHVLVNNAGAIHTERALTVDGLERTFAVNHLGYFLFTTLLLDLIERSAPARIVNVASAAANNPFGALDLDDLQTKKRYYGFKAYSRSKVANLLFTFELARRLEGKGVTVNALHPGAIGSGFGSNSWWFGQLMKVVSPLLLTPEQGAQTSIHLASTPEVEGVTGKYFVRCREARAPRPGRDPELGRKLWEASERLTAGSAAP